MKQVLVAKEKHGDFYYDASDDEQLAKSALKILTERFNEGYWYYTPDETYAGYENLADLVPHWSDNDDIETKREKIAAYREVIAAVPDADAQKIMGKKLDNALRYHKQKQVYTKWYNTVKDIVESQDWQAVVTYKSGRTSPKSWELLSERNDGEYERVELESVETND